MILTTVISTLFLSPLTLILVILAGMLLMATGRRKTGIGVTAAAGLILYLASIEPVHDALRRTLEGKFPAVSIDKPPPFDAIVVLGCGTIGSSPDMEGRSNLTPEALKRLVYGIMLFHRRETPIYVSGGRVGERAVESEAETARRALVSLGVPEAMIRMEDRSRTTWENATELAHMLKEAGIGEVALVTSAYHMPRSALAFSKAGIRFIPAPTDYKTQGISYGFSSFLPSFNFLAGSLQALREYAGLVQYGLRR